MSNGKVYIAGAGCGDPGLITVKLKKALENADCIVYDRLVGSAVLNYAGKNAELVYFGKENTEGGLIQEEINRILVKKAKEGKNNRKAERRRSFCLRKRRRGDTGACK